MGINKIKFAALAGKPADAKLNYGN